MPMYERIGPPILNDKGNTVRTDIKLSNGSRIYIQEGLLGSHFQLKFANDGNEGWWVDRQALRELITELLYIRREIVERFGEDEQDIHQPIIKAAPMVQWKFDVPNYKDLA